MAKAIPIYVESGDKKAFACSIDYPGWCRGAKNEALALEALAAYAPRYAEAAKLAKEAIATGLTVKQLLAKKALLPPEELEEVLDLRAMTELGVPGGKGIPAGG